MRKILLTLLLATSAATPALAEFPGRHNRDSGQSSSQDSQPRHSEPSQDRSQARQDRAQAREDRSQAQQERTQIREERVQRNAVQDQVPARDFTPQRNAVQDQAPARNFSPDRNVAPDRNVQVDRRANINERGRPTLNDSNQSSDTVTNWRQRERDVSAQQRQQDSRDRAIGTADRFRRESPPVNARPDRPAPLPTTAYNRSPAPTWHQDWRTDNRYDWRDYRNHHRSTFHLGIYFDPFGWGYQRWGIGWRLWPSYYSSNYWLDDPYMYRLPYAPWPYKWVRYYDDALLVNMYTGQVVDVMYDFFW